MCGSAFPWGSVLIANRNEIACRLIREVQALGAQAIAIYSDEDAEMEHVRLADVAVPLGGNTTAETYGNVDKVIAAAKAHGAEAIHPGYGFLAENIDAAKACAANGIVWVGPTVPNMEAVSYKHAALEAAKAAGVPCLPCSDLVTSGEAAIAAADQIGYPVLLKATAGGGGIGQQVCHSKDQVLEGFRTVVGTATSSFGDARLFVEKFVQRGRHVEVQMFGDGQLAAVLGDRDCSMQRRRQKVVEEGPAPDLKPSTRSALHAAATQLCESLRYRSSGTVEFILDSDSGDFYFLEVNTRMQVESGVTEMVAGVNIPRMMLLEAAGLCPDLRPLRSKQPRGHAIEVRICAESPAQAFRPSTGTLTEVAWPSLAKTQADGQELLRIDSGVRAGTKVSTYYDSMIAKIIAWGETRSLALARLRDALSSCSLGGIVTNLDYLRFLLQESSPFEKMELDTRMLNELHFTPSAVEVLKPGMQTWLQDYPGRVGYWNIGVSPSGPFDDYAFRMANALVGNDTGTLGLEMTIGGPELKFHKETVFAVCGANMQPKLNGEAVPMWASVLAPAGSVLSLYTVAGNGSRAFLAVAGGFQAPLYLGSSSTFPNAKLGGLQGRQLVQGDLLPIADCSAADCLARAGTMAPSAAIPSYVKEWTIGVLYGPHGAPDYFEPKSIEDIFNSEYRVHHNSNRLGIRLIGPTPNFARSDGGEAGLHPSNLHDYTYSVGALNFTGDMPVIIAPDGPSLGGFVCPVVIASGEMWKIGQLRPADVVRFTRICYDQARDLAVAQRTLLESVRDREWAVANRALRDYAPSPTNVSRLPITLLPPQGPALFPGADAVVGRVAPVDGKPEVVYRMSGDEYILVEYGEVVLDFVYRFRVKALMDALQETCLPITEPCPGIRSLLLKYDAFKIDAFALVNKLMDLEERLPRPEDMVVESRILYLPLAFDDHWNRAAIEKYRQSVRDTAPWLPSNIEFMCRINGLEKDEDVRDIIGKASYMVFGLGDVYLSAPCAVPVDPRTRLLSSKYNPARTYTPEGTVGIGGVYMCIYGMESPGGYQLVGRTLPIWDAYLNVPPENRGASGLSLIQI
eukprot:TRINITY_DN21707_c0_g1_i3.p1 TRINITY_DN21707_c0_g1~~TRINITY_DN21707_c0_g1_i3.p1  ORF type:complete len:1080 (-),score=157.08 TRINITY_DN21707_c0_g1_i3:101-3340(-)